MKLIASVSNPLIKDLKNLQQKKYRRQNGSFLIEGARLVSDAVKNGLIPELLLVREDRQQRYADMIELCGNTVIISAQVEAALCMTESPEGILARMKIPQQTSSENGQLVLVLDGIQDPGNLGTIIRTANSAGIRDIYFLGDNVDLYNPKVVRSAMGAIFFINPHYCRDAEKLYAELKKDGYAVCVTTLSNSGYYSLKLPCRIALVMGNEGSGVSKCSLQNADYLLTLPMDPRAESLNVAVCAGILIFDILYRR